MEGVFNMRLLLVFLHILTVSGVCDVWESGVSGNSARHQEQDGNKIRCQSFCDNQFIYFGTQWRIDFPECACVAGGGKPGPNNLMTYILNCGIFLQHTKVSIGSISKVRIEYNFRTEPDESIMEIFAVDILQSTTPSDRLIIMNPDDLTNALVTRTLYRSNLTKHYNRIRDTKDLSSERTAETSFLAYKMGDMDLENEPLWLTTVKGNNQNVQIKMHHVQKNNTVKENNLIVTVAQELIGNTLIVAIQLGVSVNPSADLLNVSLNLQPEMGLKFSNMVYTDELSMVFSATVLSEVYQLFMLSRLTIDSIVAFNVTYSLDAGKSFVGEKSFRVLNEFRYTNYSSNIPKKQLRNEQIMENFTTEATKASMLTLERRSSSVNHTVTGSQDELALCIVHHGCIIYHITTREVKKLPCIVSLLAGHNSETGLFYAATLKGSILAFTKDQRNVHFMSDIDNYKSSPTFQPAKYIAPESNFSHFERSFSARYDGFYDLTDNTWLLKF